MFALSRKARLWRAVGLFLGVLMFGSAAMAAGVNSFQTNGKGKIGFSVDTDFGQQKLKTDGNPTETDSHSDAHYTGGLFVSSSSSRESWNIFQQSIIPGYVGPGSTTTIHKEWNVLYQFKEIGVTGSYGIIDRVDVFLGLGLSAPSVKIKQYDLEQTVNGPVTSDYEETDKDVFPSHLQPSPVISLGAKWEAVRSGALRAGASLKYKKFGKSSWKESDPTASWDTLSDQDQSTDNTEVSVKRDEYSATLGASYALLEDRIEPYALLAYEGGEVKWEHTQSQHHDTQNPPTEDIGSDQYSIKGTFKIKNPLTGTLGLYLPMGAKSGEGRGGGLDVSVSFLGQTSFHVGGDIRF